MEEGNAVLGRWSDQVVSIPRQSGRKEQTPCRLPAVKEIWGQRKNGSKKISGGKEK